MTEFVNPEDLDIDVVDIDENHTWKDEVERLMKRNAYLENENAASQLMAALALKQHGAITVPKSAIAAGLPGWSLSIEDDGNDNIVIGVNPPDGV